jgi:Domain of unknown function (DUF4386)
MEHTVFEHPRRIARIAGILYLLEMLTGAVSLYALGSVVVAGDAAATAANTRAHESLFIFSFTADILQFACYIGVTALLYWLLKPVNPIISLAAAFFSLTGCIVGAVSCMFQIAPLVILRSSPYLNVFSGDQLDTLAFLLHRLYSQCFEVSFVFFGFYCLLIGWLVFRSGFIPRLVGAAMILAGLAWLLFLWPPLAESLFQFIVLGAVGEATLALWLTIAGVNEKKWNVLAHTGEKKHEE